MGNIIYDDKQYVTITTQTTRSVTVTTPDTGNRVIVGSVSGIAPNPFDISTFRLDGADPNYVLSNGIDTSTDYRVRIGIWVNPSVGSHTLTVVFSKAPSSYSQCIACYSLSGVNQSSPYIELTTKSKTFTDVPNGAVAIGHIVCSAAPSLGADQILYYYSTYCRVWYTNPCTDGDLTATTSGGNNVRQVAALMRPASFAGGVMFL